jgi:hypothetical protein
VIYLVLIIIRGGVIIGSLPILRKLGKAELPLSEALVMTWGGLRGAVGLALAIQVSIEKAGGKISDMDARRVLFYTGGIAFLTLVVNAVTCPSLVKYLGLVQTDDVKRKLLIKVCKQMLGRVELAGLKPSVRCAVEEMIDEVEKTFALKYEAILPLPSSTTCPQSPLSPMSPGSTGDGRNANYGSESSARSKTSGSSEGTEHTENTNNFRSECWIDKAAKQKAQADQHRGSSMSTGMMGALPSMKERVKERFARRASITQFNIKMFFSRQQAVLSEGEKSIMSFHDKLKKLEDLPPVVVGLLHVPSMAELTLPEAAENMVTEHPPDIEVMELINVALLSLVQAEYWHMIGEGEFIKGSCHAGFLLNSTAWAIQAKAARLGDLEILYQELNHKKRDKPRAETEHDDELAYQKTLNKDGTAVSLAALNKAVRMSAIIADAHSELRGKTRLLRVVNSTGFTAFITFVIVLNVINVFIEESNMKGKSDNEYAVWLSIEFCFITIFAAEFVLKFTALGRQYFTDLWNCFDFLLVISGIAGIIVELVWKNDEADVSSRARAFRINRIFRAMRLMRVFRLVQLLEVVRAKWSGLELSVHLANNMRTITVLTAFARAHIAAEKSLIKFFGNPEEFPGGELARCMVDSRTAICDAICSAAFEIGTLEILILERLNALRESSRITEDLTHFILDAGKMGTMNSKEAENILEPLRHSQQQWFAEEKHHLAGIFDRDKTAKLANASSFHSGDKGGQTGKVNHRISLRTAMEAIYNPLDSKTSSTGSRRNSLHSQQSAFSVASSHIVVRVSLVRDIVSS